MRDEIIDGMFLSILNDYECIEPIEDFSNFSDWVYENSEVYITENEYDVFGNEEIRSIFIEVINEYGILREDIIEYLKNERKASALVCDYLLNEAICMAWESISEKGE